MNLEIKTSPEIAELLIEEGFAIKVDNKIYQRNLTLNFFSFRKWRKTEDYDLKSEGRDKVYVISGKHHTILTKSSVKTIFKEFTDDILVLPPLGDTYTPGQYKIIHNEAKKIIAILQSFLNALGKQN